MVASELHSLLRAAVRELPLGKLSSRRWFRDKGRAERAIELRDFCALRDGFPIPLLCIVEVQFQSGAASAYQIPCVLSEEKADGELPAGFIQVAASNGKSRLWLRETLPQDSFWQEALAVLRRNEARHGIRGDFRFSATAELDRALGKPYAAAVDGGHAIPVRTLGADQSNLSVVYGDTLLYKLYSRIEDGTHPELEVCRALSTQTSFAGIPRVLGWVEYQPASESCQALGLLQRFLPGSEDAWTACLRLVHRSLGSAAGSDLDELIDRLAEITAGLHLALASLSGPAFAAEASQRTEVAALRSEIRGLCREAQQSLRSRPSDPGSERLVEAERAAELLPFDLDFGMRIRVHGDYHLGQVIIAGGEMCVVDFEGEPARPLARRRAKHSPLKDVAGMLRSFGYAAAIASRINELDDEELAERAASLERWESHARERFLAAYWRTMEASPLGASCLPKPPARRLVLAAFELEKALYEVLYEVRNRPEFVWIPLSALERVAARIVAKPAG